MRLLLLLSWCLACVAVRWHDRLHCPTTQSYMNDLITNGEFKSPGFPYNYTENLNCVYEIMPLEGWSVALNIEYFQTELNHDVVEIYQLYYYQGSLNATRHATLSGDHLPQNQFISQKSGGFRVIFKTDFSESKFAGFKMSFQRFHETVSNHGLNLCPEVFHMAESQTKEFPVVKNRFMAKGSCVFQVNATESVEIQVNSLKHNVRVDVFEADSVGEFGKPNILSSYDTYKTTKFPQAVASRTNSLIILVSMMSSIENLSDAYNITYHAVASPCNCPPEVIELNYTETTLTSPGWPVEYCNNLGCRSKFKVANGLPTKEGQVQTVLVEFYEFKIEAVHDLFEFYLGENKLKLMTPYDDNPPAMINYFTFPAGDPVINFTTDNTIVTTGYKLGVKIIDRPKKCKCPDLQGNFAPPSGNKVFALDAECGFMDCFWTITPPDNDQARHRLVLMVWFNLGSWSEFIEISGDQKIGPNLNTLRLTSSMIEYGKDAAGKQIVMNSDDPVQIWYHREDENPRQSPNGNGRTLTFSYNWTERCNCGNLQLDAKIEWLTLTSPDFPSPYCGNMNCVYVLTAPEGSIVSANVTLLELEFNMDTLSFYDGPTMNSSRLDMLTGIDFLSEPVESSSNQMTICFSSDATLSGKGFNLNYKSKVPKRESGSSGFSVFKVFLLLGSLGLVAFGGVYLFKRYQHQTGFTLPSFSSFQLSSFDSQSITASINSLIRSNNTDSDH